MQFFNFFSKVFKFPMRGDTYRGILSILLRTRNGAKDSIMAKSYI